MMRAVPGVVTLVALALAGCLVEAPGEDICPVVRATLLEDGRVALAWEPIEEAGAYQVYGPGPDGPLQPLARMTGLSFAHVPPQDAALRYRVTAVSGDLESGGCPVVEATLIPVFPGPVAVVSAVAVTLGLAAWVGRGRCRGG